MTPRFRSLLALTAGVLAVLALAGSALAARTPAPLKLTSSSTGISRTLTLTPAGVRQLIDGGAQVTVPRDEGAHPLAVVLFVPGRVLARGGIAIPKRLLNDRRNITDIVRLHVHSAGSHTATLHVFSTDRAALLRAGTITLGIVANGY